MGSGDGSIRGLWMPRAHGSHGVPNKNIYVYSIDIFLCPSHSPDPTEGFGTTTVVRVETPNSGRNLRGRRRVDFDVCPH